MEPNAEKIAFLEQELQDLKTEYQDFTYIVSHDLMSALRSIDGFSSIISKTYSGQLDEKTEQHFTYMKMGVANAKEILNSLLQCSRVSTHAREFATCDLNAVLKGVKHQLTADDQLPASSIIHSSLPQITGDADQLSQLFYHLLHNGLIYKAIDQEPVVKILSTETLDSWVFEINDNGIGIHEKDYDKVFKALRRGVLKKDYPGIGMGLTIARKIIQRHGGTIWVESTLGKGSQFFFTISKQLQTDAS